MNRLLHQGCKPSFRSVHDDYMVIKFEPFLFLFHGPPKRSEIDKQTNLHLQGSKRRGEKKRQIKKFNSLANSNEGRIHSVTHWLSKMRRWKHKGHLQRIWHVHKITAHEDVCWAHFQKRKSCVLLIHVLRTSKTRFAFDRKFDKYDLVTYPQNSCGMQNTSDVIQTINKRYCTSLS